MESNEVEPLVYTVSEAGQLLGICRNKAYEGAANGEIPTIRIGRRLLVPKVALKRMLAGYGQDAA